MPEKRSFNPEDAQAVLVSLKESREYTEDDPIYQEVPGLKEKVEGLPEIMIFEIEDYAIKLKRYIEDPVDVLELASDRVGELRRNYLDTRFDVPNQTYLRFEILRNIDTFVSEEPTTEKANSYGILNLDLNGLKSVNDTSGHEAGDKFLARAVAVFKSGATTKRLEQEGIEVFFAAGGGDEFSVLLQGGNKNIDIVNSQDEKLSIMEQALSDYQQEINEMDCSDLIDFSDPTVREKLNKALKVPEGFEFKGTIAGGTASLSEAASAYKDEVKEHADLDYNGHLNNIMGLMFDISDERMSANKSTIKSQLKEGNEHEQFLAKVYARNQESILLEIAIDELRAENDRLRQMLAEK